MADSTPDCLCGHSFHGHLYCWDESCECPEQRDAIPEAVIEEGWQAWKTYAGSAPERQEPVWKNGFTAGAKWALTKTERGQA